MREIRTSGLKGESGNGRGSTPHRAGNYQWPEITHSVRTGKTAFSKVFGKELFDYLPTDEAAGKAFDEAMAGYTAMTAGAIVAGYEFASFKRIIDVGGGNGALIAAILEKNVAGSGVTFDLEASSVRARVLLAGKGLGARCEVVAGDFFKAIPSGGDAYALKAILHDWDDERCVAILKNVRHAMRPDGRLLVMETVIDPRVGEGAPGKLFDLNMMVMAGGRERTADEFAAIFRASGFELSRVVPVHPMMSVVEGRPA